MANSHTRLHPEHGLNPTIAVCAWCDEDTGEIALLGATYRGKAPQRMVVNDHPCATCEGQMAQGITFLERAANGQPTGRWCVVREEAVRAMVDVSTPDGQSKLDTVLRRRKAQVDTELYAHIIAACSGQE